MPPQLPTQPCLFLAHGFSRDFASVERNWIDKIIVLTLKVKHKINHKVVLCCTNTMVGISQKCL